MATLAETARNYPAYRIQRERRFFLNMALAIAAAVLIGFGAYVVLGISSFTAPWWVHVHAVTYMGWIVLYLNQNWLIVRGDVAQHQRMGRLMAGWAVWMLLVGTSVLWLNTTTHRTPPVFQPAFLITMDMINILVFLALLVAGLLNRHRPDWHKRLMLSATICVIAPAFGRMTVVSIGFSLRTIIVLQLGFIAVGLIRDWRENGHPHQAYFWGAAAMAAMGLSISPIAALAPVIAFANALAAG